MELSTRLLLVIVPSIVGWPHYSNAGCPDGHFPCHQDCCINAVQFCNNHGSQLRCQKCELRKAHCGTPDVHEHCFLFCDKFLAAMTTPFSTTMTDNSTTQGVTQDRSVSTPVLTSEILAAIVVPCVLVVIVASVVVLVLCVLAKRRNWLTNTCRRVCKQKEHENDVENPLNEPPSQGDHNLRGEEPAENTSLMTNGQPAGEPIDDQTVLISLDKRNSDATLESNEGVATSEVREISDAVNEQPPTTRADSFQQREVSPDNSTGSHTNGAPYHQRDARGPAVNQTNQTNINICTHGGCQPPPDVIVSTPSNSAYSVRSDPPTGRPSGAQASYSPSPQCNDQRLYTNPSKPPDHEQETVELATGVGNPTRQYRHLQNPIT